MKTYKRILWVCLVIVVFLAISCTPLKSQKENNTYISTSDSIAQLSVTQTATNFLTFDVHTPKPTFTIEEQVQFWSLLDNDANCDLPCMLGIMPGKTSWLSAKEILEMYSINRSVQYDKTRSTSTNSLYSATILIGGNGVDESQTKIYLIISVDNNNLVKYIITTFEVFRNGLPDYNSKYLSVYSLRQIFLRNGPPDYVYYAPEKGGGYRLHIVYKKTKIIIALSSRAKQDRTMCPNIGDGDISSMRVGLANPSDSSIDIRTLIPYPFYENDVLIEESTKITLMEFYYSIISDQQPACIYVK